MYRNCFQILGCGQHSLKHPQIFKCHNSNHLTPRDNQTIQNLIALGFSRETSSSMLNEHPHLTLHNTKSVEYTFQVFQSLGFKTEEIKDVLAQEPKLFSQNPRKLKNSFLFLLKELGNHDGRIAAKEAPSILMDNVVLTSEKIDYCITEMCLQKTIIAKSQILKFPFDFIRTRHGFASRSGYYKKIDAKNREGTPQNLTVSDLLFSSDRSFVTHFKGLSIEEYLIFEEMISDEKMIRDVDDESSDDESDDENAV